MGARPMAEAQRHLQNASVGAALQVPPCPVTLVSSSPAWGHLGPRFITLKLLWLLLCPRLSLRLEHTSIPCKEPGTPSSAQHPCPPSSLLFLTFSSLHTASVLFRDPVNNYPFSA